MGGSADLSLIGGTVYVSPTEEALRDGVVRLTGGVIASVGSRTSVAALSAGTRIDCAGRTAMAGFWNSHVHFFERKWADAAAIPATELTSQLQDMLTRFGFTSVFDLSSLWENTRVLRDRIESGEVRGPRIRSTGEGLVPPGAVPPDVAGNLMGVMKTPMPEVTDAAQASAAARKLLAAGVDGIKLFASAPRGMALDASVFRAAVNEAHECGKPVFVHPNNANDISAAVEGGVDIIAHTTPHSGAWHHDLLTRMRERDVALTPTLTLWKYYARHDRVSAQQKVVETCTGQLRAWLERGGRVLFGNDLGAVEYDPAEEYRLMQEAGMDFRQILEALTTAPAQQFGDVQHAGRIAPGYDADLVILNGDPARDIGALTEVEMTIRGGKIIYTRETPSR